MTEMFTLCGTPMSRIGFGTLYITVDRGFGAAKKNAIALLREAASLGVRLFDTADSYGNGSAESALRDALHPYAGLVIATKGGYRHERPGSWVSDGRPAHLRAACEASLKRLGVERIDLYQLHCADPRVPYADSIGTLADLRREGKIAAIGISNVGVGELETARRAVEVVSVQNPFNVRYKSGAGVLEACAAAGIAFLPWMPLGDGSIAWTDRTLVRIAKKHAATAAQIALAALLARSPVMLPIPGTGSIEHLRENVAAGRISLDDDDRRALWGV